MVRKVLRYQFETQKFGVLDADGTTIRTYMTKEGNPTKSYQYYLNQATK